MRLLAAALAISVTGCSFVFVDGPPKRHAQMTTFDCSTSRAVPVLDSLFTALQLVNLGIAVKDTNQDWNDIYKNSPPFSRKTGGIVYAVLAAVGAGGAYYGFSRTTACRDAKADLATRQMNRPPPAAPGWPPPVEPTPPAPPVTPTVPPPEPPATPDASDAPPPTPAP